MFENIIKEIKMASSVIVAGHIMPDGDDVSSVSTMVCGLTKLGINAVGVIDDEIPEYLQQFDFVKEYIRDFSCAEKNPSDLIIIVDASSPDRVGRVNTLFDMRRVIVLDHHSTNSNYGNLNFVDSDYASSAQIVKDLLNEMECPYDEKLATMNLLGIATDTGFFKYSNTSSKVLRDAAELVDKGANLNYITNKVLENKPIENIMLFKDVIDKMKFYNNNKVVASYVSVEMLKKYGIQSKDTPPYVGDLRALKGVEVAIIFNESEDNIYHVSMRSKEFFNLTETAVKYGGGGHVRAAGFSMKTDDIEKSMDDICKEISEKMGD